MKKIFLLLFLLITVPVFSDQGVFTDNEAALITNFANVSNGSLAVNFIQLSKSQQKAFLIAKVNQAIADLDTALSNLDVEKTARETSLNAQKDILNSILTKINAL